MLKQVQLLQVVPDKIIYVSVFLISIKLITSGNHTIKIKKILKKLNYSDYSKLNIFSLYFLEEEVY